MSNYQRTEAGEKLAQEALSKCIVYFSDGNERTFFSRDKQHTYALPNQEVGISRLKKMVYKWRTSVDRAFIYDTDTGVELWNFKKGQWAASC